jgi:hypothetical protein
MTHLGIIFRHAGTLPVFLAAATILLTDAEPLLAGVAGLCAASYLVLRHNGRRVSSSASAMLAALGFSVVGVLAASLPIELSWLPLLAPPTVFAGYLLATRPLYVWVSRSTRMRSGHQSPPGAAPAGSECRG